MAGRVHEIEHISLAVLRLVAEANGLRLDGDAALALDLHAVEHLRAHLALLEAAAALDEAVGKGRFAVVDMGDDRKIADMAEIGHGARKRFGGEVRCRRAARNGSARRWRDR